MGDSIITMAAAADQSVEISVRDAQGAEVSLAGAVGATVIIAELVGADPLIVKTGNDVTISTNKLSFNVTESEAANLQGGRQYILQANVEFNDSTPLLDLMYVRVTSNAISQAESTTPTSSPFGRGVAFDDIESLAASSAGNVFTKEIPDNLGMIPTAGLRQIWTFDLVGAEIIGFGEGPAELFINVTSANDEVLVDTGMVYVQNISQGTYKYEARLVLVALEDRYFWTISYIRNEVARCYSNLVMAPLAAIPRKLKAEILSFDGADSTFVVARARCEYKVERIS